MLKLPRVLSRPMLLVVHPDIQRIDSIKKFECHEKVKLQTLSDPSI